MNEITKKNSSLFNFLILNENKPNKDVEKWALEKYEGNMLSAGTLPTLTGYQCCSCSMLYNIVNEYLGHHSNSSIESYCQSCRRITDLGMSKTAKY